MADGLLNQFLETIALLRVLLVRKIVPIYGMPRRSILLKYSNTVQKLNASSYPYMSCPVPDEMPASMSACRWRSRSLRLFC